MTDKEHALVIAMLFKQAQSMKFILDLLKTKGLIEQDELPINAFATRMDPFSNEALYQETLRYYAMAAKELGLELPPTLPTTLG